MEQLPINEVFHLIHDRDSRFSAESKQTVKAANGTLLKLPVQSPNLNARCERVIQTIQYDCLRKFIVFGKRHLDHLLSEFVTYNNEFRAHSSRDFLTPTAESSPEENNTIALDKVVCREHLGGLLNSYGQKAASSVAAIAYEENLAPVLGRLSGVTSLFGLDC